MGGTLLITQGTARDFERRIPDAAGNLFDPDADPPNPSPFLDSDTLSAKVWAGGSRAAILTPTPAWISADLATYRVSFEETDTATQPLGVYRYQAFVTRGGRTGKVDDARFVITGTPGDGAAPLAFTTRTDLTFYAPWLEDLQDEGDEAGFAAEQLRATNRLISVLVKSWKYSGGLTLGQPGFMTTSVNSGGAPPSYWLRQMLVPLVPGSTPPASMPDRVRSGTPPNLIDPTVSTALLLHPEVKEVCARWAISYVCDRQISRDGNREYPTLAARFGREGDGLYRSQKFEIDLSNPQQGWAGIVIDGGSGNLKE